MAAPVPCCCLVPQEAVSLFVGEEEATVRRIQRESGANVHITGEDDTPPALMDRIVSIRGTSDQKEAACREVVRITHRSQEVQEGEEGIFVLIVPESATGFIIGPKGSTISSLIEATHAEVSISRHTIAGTQLQPISLAGSLVQTVAAAGRINALLQQLADRGRLQPEAWKPQLQLPPPREKETSRERGRSGGPRPVAGGRGEGRAVHGVAQQAPAAAAPAKSPAGSSRSPTPGAASASSRSPTPASSLAPGAGRGGRPPASGTEGGSASSRSCSRGTAGTAPRAAAGASDGGASSVYFVVEAALAAWIVGKKGRTIADMQAASGAHMDVAKSDGATRLAEIRGSRKAKAAAIKLLLDAVDGYPGDASREVRMLIPAAVADAFTGEDGDEALRQVAEASGAELDLEDSGEGAGDLLLLLSGGRAAITKAAQLVAVRLAEAQASAAPLAAPAAALPAASPAPVTAPASGRVAGAGAPFGADLHGGSIGKGRGASPSPARSAATSTTAPRRRTPSPPTPRTPGGADELAAAAAVASATSASSERRARSLTPPPGRRPAAAGPPSEAALLQALLAGPEPDKAQLQLALPVDFVSDVLDGQLKSISTRSGSRLELGAEHGASGDNAAARLVTVTGTMLGNSMAILYIQELMLQNGA